MNKMLVILGPTATGKTDLGLFLASKFSGEVIACDSRQVYQKLDIGTGKLGIESGKVNKRKGVWLVNKVPIHLYDQVGLGVQFTVKDYIEKASLEIESISQKGKLPIVVGGSGLYLKGLLTGFDNLKFRVDQNLRRSLLDLTLTELAFRLKRLSPQRWGKLSPSDQKNSRRLIRALELSEAQKNPSWKYQGLEKKYQILKIGLFLPRPVLYQNINHTVDSWLDRGIIEEVKKLNKSGVSLERFLKIGLNYKIAAQFLNGEVQAGSLPEKMKREVRRYAKRQLTWFKKEKDVNWFNSSLTDTRPQVEKLVRLWYYGQNGDNGTKN